MGRKRTVLVQTGDMITMSKLERARGCVSPQFCMDEATLVHVYPAYRVDGWPRSGAS